MELFYVILSLATLALEVSWKFDTCNPFKKLALLSICLGGILSYANIKNSLILIGILFYSMILLYEYVRKNKGNNNETRSKKNYIR